MKILKFLLFSAIILAIISVSDLFLLPLTENRSYPCDDVTLRETKQSYEAESEYTQAADFELRYDLTDPDLDVNSLELEGLKVINTQAEWKDYTEYCIKKGYVHIFFEVPENLPIETDSLMTASEITSVIIYTYPIHKNGYKKMGYTFTYTYAHDILTAVKNDSLSRLDEKKLAVYNAAKSFLSTISELSDYEKELAIHNYVCETITYSNDSARPDITNCYGGLIEGFGNCQAYTDAFSLLCGLEGFNCGRITCKADGTEHSLNYIVINGEYYFVDCTFDDGISDPERGYGLFYFNAAYDIMTISHTFSSLPFTPVQTINSNNYYLHNDLYADSPYSLEQVYKRIAENSPTGEILFNTQNGDASLTDIFTKAPCGYSKISVSKFTFGENYVVLKFTLS